MSLTIAPAWRTLVAAPSWRHPAVPIAVIGVIGAAVTAIGAGVPSFWGDEAASVISAQRSLPSLFGELLRVDAVHGLYYVFLHFWIGVAGTSESAVRFPSAVAAGFAIAGTVALGRELFGMTIGMTAGVVAMVIPQLTRMAIEARSYAFGMAAAVWLTWLLVRLVRRGETRRRKWLVYAVGAGLSVTLFVYLGLLVIVHLVVVATARPSREVLRAWLQSLAVAGLVALPLIVAAMAQQRQVAFLAHRHYATFANVIVRQWFGTWYVAALAWALIVTGAVTVLRRPATAQARSSALVVWVWLVAPTGLLLAGTAWLHPMYNMRYVALCVPAVAIAMALGINGLAQLAHSGRARAAIAGGLIALLIAACVPVYVAQRSPYAKDGGSDLRQIADAVRHHARPGDAVIFDESTKPRGKRRLAIDLYPAAFAGIDDIALRTRAADRAGLWDQVEPVGAITAAVLAHPVVWVVEAAHSTPEDVNRITGLGYHVADTIRLHRTDVYELTRNTS